MVCLQALTDCVNYRPERGHCGALTDTRFIGRCPFYKNSETIASENIGVDTGKLHPIKAAKEEHK